MELKENEISDIIMMYRQAADKKEQIKILADLHLISRAEVCEILKGAGYSDTYIEKALRVRSSSSSGESWSLEEEDSLRKLVYEKRSYTECALILGRSRGSISSKVYQLGLRRGKRKCL